MRKRSVPAGYQQLCIWLPSPTAVEVKLVAELHEITLSDFINDLLTSYGETINPLPRSDGLSRQYKSRINPFISEAVRDHFEALFGPHCLTRLIMASFLKYKAEHQNVIEEARKKAENNACSFTYRLYRIGETKEQRELRHQSRRIRKGE